MKWSKVAALSLFVAGTIGGIRADEGRIPIFEPTVISAPGHYVVTRDITEIAGSVLEIGASRVTVDLNGHTLRGGNGTGDIISILPGSFNVIVRNGTLYSGDRGVVAGENTSVRLEHLDIKNTQGGVFLPQVWSAEILSCRVDSTWGIQPAVFVFAGIQGAIFRIVDSHITNNAGGGLRVDGVTTTAEIKDNIIAYNQGTGLEVFEADGVRVVGNTFTGNKVVIAADGTLFLQNTTSFLVEDFAVLFISDANLILDNNVDDIFVAGINGASVGIQLDGGLNTVRGNHVTRVNGHGIRVSGGGNLIEDNFIQAGFLTPSDCALYFEVTAINNVYRNNRLMGPMSVCGPANINGGGNL